MPEVAEQHPFASMGNWGFVGAGSLGSSLARALATKGADVTAVASRRPDRARELAAALPDCRVCLTAAEVVRACQVVALAVPDDAIVALDASLPWRAGQFAIHLSGALGLDPLAHATATGAHAVALHPLMTFPRPEPSASAALARFAGCTWACEASDPSAAAAAHDIVHALGGRVVHLRAEDRVPYHLSAVLASNYVVTLLGTAVAIWQGLGLNAVDAREALVPLLRATVERLGEQGPAAALAGPIARGDEGTVAAHLAWLRAHSAAGAREDMDAGALRDAYLALARLTIPLACERGSLAADEAQRLRVMLRQDAEQRRKPL
jgi:predicted short-subunit dehydrogenase-like oxidoreductase (DUF2520 family)